MVHQAARILFSPARICLTQIQNKNDVLSSSKGSSLSANCCSLWYCLSTKKALQNLSQTPVESITAVVDFNCRHFAMPLSTDSIITIFSVLVALPPSILIVITVLRRLYHVSRYTHYSRGQCQYSSFRPNVSTYHSPFRPTTYYATDAFQISSFDPSMRTASNLRPQRLTPVISTPISPFTDQTLIQSPPPAYQPLHLNLARVHREPALP